MELYRVDNKPHTPFYIIRDEEFGLLQIYYDLCFECWMFFYTGNKTETHIIWDNGNPISDLELLVLFGMTLDDVPGVLKYMEMVRRKETRITSRVDNALWFARHQKRCKNEIL